MVVTANGVVTRVAASAISRQGRPATGVRVQTLDGDDIVVSVNKIVNTDEDDKAEETVAEAKEELASAQGNIFSAPSEETNE